MTAQVFVTEKLERRHGRVADDMRKNIAFKDIARQLAECPAKALPRLVSLAMELCKASSTGISLYEEGSPGVFRWHYLEGLLKPLNGTTTPRDFSPCGVCLDERRPVLCERPERLYTWIRDAGISVPEVLLVPLYIGLTQPLGTLWVVSSRREYFHGDHARVISELSGFIGLAFQMIENERHTTLGLNRQHTGAGETKGAGKRPMLTPDLVMTSDPQITNNQPDKQFQQGRAPILAETIERTPHSISRWQVNRAEQYIDLHWDQPMTVKGLSRAIGASERSVFKAFREVHRCSPMAFVKTIRLHKSREKLQSFNPLTSVTGVALSCGFQNLGHFSKSYYRFFGELPSETLNRAKGTYHV